MQAGAKPKRAKADPAKLLEKKYGIHQIRVITPIPELTVNAYLIEKPFLTLIDAPPDGGLFISELDALLKQTGHSVEDIQTIIVTHSHFDHFGSARTIAEASGAGIWIAEGSARSLEDYENVFCEEDISRSEILQEAGVEASEIEYSREVYRRSHGFACGVRPSRYLRAGDTFELSSLSFTVMDVPGHTPWCILIHDVNNTMAFTGDLLPIDISSHPLVQQTEVAPKGHKTLKSYITSLRKMRDMDLGIALPGHGDIIENPSKRIDALLSLIEERRKAILGILTKGAQTPYGITRQLFPKLPRYRLLRGISDVLGHLEVLEEDGLVERGGGHPAYFSLTIAK